uniref:Poly [ADP-ribose] polymerase n=1 Tax=Maylandia zebra TaxID=106582 RepID=A0A3P9BEQ5_9CICH
PPEKAEDFFFFFFDNNHSMLENTLVEYMDTADTPWCWYYLADCGQWHQFEDDPDLPFSSEAVENFYLKNSKAVLNTSSFSYRGQIDFSGNFCIKTADISVITDFGYFLKLIPLSEHSPEYWTVKHYVKTDGLLDRTILSINRIQNLDLWELYCRKKKQLMRIQGIKEIQERRLFHGTDIKNVDYICKYNFDVRLAGQHGNRYGKGKFIVLCKSEFLTLYHFFFYGGKTQPVHSGETKIIFLARVMTGKPVAGQSHFQKPDHENPENLHDSCVDVVNHPRIFVIFDPNQIYPEYLIQYS